MVYIINSVILIGVVFVPATIIVLRPILQYIIIKKSIKYQVVWTSIEFTEIRWIGVVLISIKDLLYLVCNLKLLIKQMMNIPATITISTSFESYPTYVIIKEIN